MQKQTSKHINELVLELTQVCFDINTKTNYCCFLEMKGHLDSLTVRIAKSKSEFARLIYCSGYIFYNDSYLSVSEMEEMLTDLINELSKYLIAPKHISEPLMEIHNQLQQGLNS